MATSDITVTLRAKDEITPVLKVIQRRLWWMRYGEVVVVGVLTGSVGFLVGLLLWALTGLV